MKRIWKPDELTERWTFASSEIDLLANKSGATRLGFAIALKFFQLEGRFPSHSNEVAAVVVAHIARQIKVPSEKYLQYDWGGRSIKYHRAQIRSFLGFRGVTLRDIHHLGDWLSEKVLPHDHALEHLRNAVYQRLRTLRIEPPTPDQIDRHIRTALHAFEKRFCTTIFDSLQTATQAQLEELLSATGTAQSDPSLPERSAFTELKHDPGRIGLESVFTEIARLERIRRMALPENLFRNLSTKVLRTYRQQAAVEELHEMQRHPKALRYTLLSIFSWLRSKEITDGLVELLNQVVHRIGARAERRIEEEFIKDLKRVAGKNSLLFQLAEAAVTHPEGIVKNVLYPVVSEQTLRELVLEWQATGTAYQQKVRTVIRNSYRSHYRRMVPPLLNTLEFRSNNEVHRPIIQALELLKKYKDLNMRLFPVNEEVPIDGVVRGPWREAIFEQDQKEKPRVNRITYEICVLQTLREQLRCKEIWVVGANRYRNPDEDLPTDFDTRREEYYAALNLPLDADTFIKRLQQSMSTELEMFNDGMPKNPSVKILPKGNGWISLSPLDAQPEPSNLVRLKEEIIERWPMTNLLDILKETDLRIDFTKHFKSPTSHENLDRETLQKRLLLCLHGLGTNTGLKRTSSGANEASYTDLLYVRRRFINKEQLRNAIAQVVNAIFRARLPQIWGEGTTSCASDSKQFGAWDQNLMTEWHVRYGGRGVMIYWHVERNSVCIYSQLKTCSSSEVAAMIEGVLRHCTEMEIEKTYVDTHGQSVVAFAFCHLLNFQLAPRLKRIHAQKLYRPTPGQPQAFPHLQPVLTRPINWDLILQQYDQMVKYSTALRLGTAETEAILRRFTRNNRQHPTYQALAELGKANKTIFLCQYLRSEALRREIHEGLNMIENWNSANHFICYGKGGEIASNQTEDQELSMLSLHLLQNCMVYINTLMIQRVLAEPQWMEKMKTEDLRALTPLIYSHINPYGTFRLDMDERLSI